MSRASEDTAMIRAHEITAAVNALAEAARPERIILFGSYAAAMRMTIRIWTSS